MTLRKNYAQRHLPKKEQIGKKKEKEKTKQKDKADTKRKEFESSDDSGSSRDLNILVDNNELEEIDN